MTAASGVLHKEYHEAEFSRKGGKFHVVQLGINLPAKDYNTGILVIKGIVQINQADMAPTDHFILFKKKSPGLFRY